MPHTVPAAASPEPVLHVVLAGITYSVGPKLAEAGAV